MQLFEIRCSLASYVQVTVQLEPPLPPPGLGSGRKGGTAKRGPSEVNIAIQAATNTVTLAAFIVVSSRGCDDSGFRSEQ